MTHLQPSHRGTAAATARSPAPSAAGSWPHRVGVHDNAVAQPAAGAEVRAGENVAAGAQHHVVELVVPDRQAGFDERSGAIEMFFAAVGGDFYKIDPLLFSPAEVWLTSATSGRTFHGGRVNAGVLRTSLFAG